MKTRRLLPSLLAAVSLVAAAAPTAPLAQEANVSTQPVRNNDKAPAQAPITTPSQIVEQLAGGAFLVTERKHPIWLGKAKRGNRRGRSRWNYRR